MTVIRLITITSVPRMTERRKTASDAIAVGTRWRSVLIAIAAAPIAAWCAGQTLSSISPVSRTSTPAAIEGRLARRLDESESKPLIQPLREVTTTPNAPRYNAVDHRPPAETERTQTNQTRANQTRANRVPTDRMLMRVAMANGSGAIETPPPDLTRSSSLKRGKHNPLTALADAVQRSPVAGLARVSGMNKTSVDERSLATPATVGIRKFVMENSADRVNADKIVASAKTASHVLDGVAAHTRAANERLEIMAPSLTDTPFSIDGHLNPPDGDMAIDFPSEEVASVSSVVVGDATLPAGAAALHALPTNIPPPISPGPWSCQLDPYRLRADALPDRSALLGVGEPAEPPAPLDVDVWWQRSVARPMGLSQHSLPIDLASVIPNRTRFVAVRSGNPDPAPDPAKRRGRRRCRLRFARIHRGEVRQHERTGRQRTDDG